MTLSVVRLAAVLPSWKLWKPCRIQFMGCPVVQPAVAWLGALWSKVVAGVQLPLDARVLLAGDHTVWDPEGGDAGRALWTHLRLLFCRAVWHLRCHRMATGKVFTAAAVVELTAAAAAQQPSSLGWEGYPPGLAAAGC
jgi:hypothetical protein